MRIFIIDIDNTIFSVAHHNYIEAKPIQSRIEVVNNLYREGNTIIYWTARGTNTNTSWQAFTKFQLDQAGCLYHELRMNKPEYDVWIDDKAINAAEFFM